MWAGFAAVGRALDTTLKSQGAWWAVHLIPAGFLVSALDPWPGGFYLLVRVVVSIAALLLALLVAYRDGGVSAWSVAFGLTALLFNPVVPMEFPPDVWAAYVAIAALFAVHLVATRTIVEPGALE
jgi:hypothetical protein